VRNVALFVPCYVDQLRPEVGLAALELLEARGFAVAFPREQTCCGQPFLSAGARGDAARLAASFVRVFSRYDAVVAPSGSCAATLRRHLAHPVDCEEASALGERVFELCEFLVAQGAEAPAPCAPAAFPHRVALHASCHALRELRLGTPSETREPTRVDPARALLERVPGLELVPLTRPDECCGFGGVFAVEEEAVSCRMALDRLADHRAAHAEVITSTDVSCLLQLEGVARRRGYALRVLHVAEILAARSDAGAAKR
jgi:L-lactate dehydrogenase complex protein LldE